MKFLQYILREMVEISCPRGSCWLADLDPPMRCLLPAVQSFQKPATRKAARSDSFMLLRRSTKNITKHGKKEININGKESWEKRGKRSQLPFQHAHCPADLQAANIRNIQAACLLSSGSPSCISKTSKQHNLGSMPINQRSSKLHIQNTLCQT